MWRIKSAAASDMCSGTTYSPPVTLAIKSTSILPAGERHLARQHNVQYYAQRPHIKTRPVIRLLRTQFRRSIFGSSAAGHKHITVPFRSACARHQSQRP
jgi:hypothetical protein